MMKKNYLWVAAMASLLSMTACSDDASSIAMPEVPGEVVMEDGTTIEIAISNTGIGSRAARPVGSSAAANNVNKVQLKFYKKNGAQWENATIQAYKEGTKGTEDIDQWKNNIVDFTEIGPFAPEQTDQGVPGTEGVPGNQSRVEESKKIRLVGLEAGKDYRIVAYGYNDKDGNEINDFPYGTPVEDVDTKGLFSTAESHGKDGYTLEEVFAGYAEATTKDDSKFTSAPKITITRQVAGILAYFKIPTHANGELVKYVKVIANDKSKGFKFPAKLLGENKDFNGIDNKPGETEEDVLITFDMEKSASNWNGGNPEGDYYTTNNSDDNYEVPAEQAKGLADNYIAPKGLMLKGNTFFGARYVLPYEKHVASQTLTVVLCNAKGDAVKTLKVVTKNVPTTPSTDEDRSHNYDIRCNNFYSIGKKLASGNTTGTPDPENPDPNPNPDPQPEGPDEPIDLGATDQIIVEINDAWDVLHDMGIEE